MTQYRYRITFTRLRVSTFTAWRRNPYACMADFAALAEDYLIDVEPIDLYSQTRTGDHHQ